MAKKIKVLFLCTGNSCRSQMAEGWARHLKGDEIEAYSAGIETHGLNPLAVKVMAEAGVDISGQRSKKVDELEAVDFDLVVTVCGHANESCPTWLSGKAKVVHVGFDDPPTLAKGAKNEEEALAHYRRVRDEIRDCIKDLPGNLDRGRTGASVTSGVRERFDRAAAQWDTNPSRTALAKAVAEAIQETVPLRPDMDAMDFGAGTGLVTLGLLPYVGSLTAVDASGEMLRVLDEKLKALQIGNVRTMLCEIGKTRLPVARFDLIVSSMVLHHIPDVPEALRGLRPCLRSGGWIALADLDTEDGSFHADSTGVYHHGLDRKQVCR
jgi:arsenate reductase